jgi:nicotinamide riboside kinase
MGQKVRRINLFAGAGAGKSTLAYWLAFSSKTRHLRAELIQEYIKTWAYLDIVPEGWDQWHIFNKQLRREEVLLRKKDKAGENKVSFIITDSPVYLSAVYAEYFKSEYVSELFKAHEMYEAAYPSLNLFLKRDDSHYKPEGRYQDLEQAKEFDSYLMAKLSKNLKFHTFDVTQREDILKLVLEHV